MGKLECSSQGEGSGIESLEEEKWRRPGGVNYTLGSELECSSQGEGSEHKKSPDLLPFQVSVEASQHEETW